MAMQGGRGYQSISSMLLDRMSEIRSTYDEEHKKRLMGKTKKPSGTQVRSYKSGQAFYYNPNGKR